MARPSSRLQLWGQYLGVRCAVAGITAFDVNMNLRSAKLAGQLMYKLDKRHVQRCEAHLRLAFPQANDQTIDRLACQSFEHFMQFVVEFCHTPRLIHENSWSKLLDIQNVGQVVEIVNQGKPAILITGHLGNWEVLGYLMAFLGIKIHAIARPLDNPLISQWVYGIRQRRGLNIITKWGATGPMLDVIDRGEILAFIADQNAGDKGIFVPFFGKLASTYKSIGLLAMQRNLPIVCGYAQRVQGRFRYALGTGDVIYPQDWQNQPDPLFYITARYVRALEMMIRQTPSQYLWMHRRWKSRPRFERLGKPMPAALRRNLEALPWMDQPLLDQVIYNSQVHG